MEFSSTLRSNRANQIGSTLGTGGTFKAYTGPPAGVANAATGTLLTTLTNVTYTNGTAQETFTATADPSAAASGTPGYGRLLTSTGAVHAEGTAGIGTAAVLGAVTVTSGAITAVALTSGGSGFPPNSTVLLTIVNPAGGDGYGAIVTAAINASGVMQTPTVPYGGQNYPATGVTATAPQPYDFLFTQAVSQNGNVSLTSATFTEGNS